MLDGFNKVDLCNVCLLKKFFEKKKSRFCEFTVGEKYMWRSESDTCFKIDDDTLYMYEIYDTNKISFYFPITDNIKKALDYLDNLCLANHFKLKFTCLEKNELDYLLKRYKHVKYYSNRDWSDYFYDANSLQTFAGKHLSSKRHNLNKFIKNNPNYVFHIANAEDIERIKAFYLFDKSQIAFDNKDEINEYDISLDLIKNFNKLNQICGYITIDNNVVAYSIGEVVGDVLFIHLEKALAKEEGCFQAIVNEFAKSFKDKIKFINREDDNGDPGLRESKIQYHPLEILEKCFFKVENNIDLIHHMPHIVIDNDIYLDDIKEKDKKEYYKLTVDDELNKYWGYDYRKDISEENVNEDNVFEMLINDKHNKDDFSFGVFKNNELVGEIVFHEIEMVNASEIGFRIIKEYQNKGIMSKAVKAAISFAFDYLHFDYLKVKCFKENIPSYKLIEKNNFKKIKEDETFDYFILNR
ncbi:MAG: GNAT family N-acetyltransferase [Bacilli bacterium]